MSDLYINRLKKHFQQNIKYLTLVFNDFFVLAIIFLLGGFLFWYSQALKQMPTGAWFYPLIVFVVLAIPLFIGKLASLLKPADSYYLFTEDNQMKDYLKKAQNYSMLVPTIVILLVAGLLFPFATAKANISLLNYGGLVIGLLLAKYNQFQNQSRNFFISEHFQIAQKYLFFVELIEILITILIGYPLLLVAEMIWFIVLRANSGQLFMWTPAIEFEERRQEVVNGIFSLFTDVKDRPIKIKRRKYLDFLLDLDQTKNPDQFLFARSLIRNPDSLALVIRMTTFGVLLGLVINNPIWLAILETLVIYLTIYQLLPLYHQYEQNMMYKILPIDPKNKISAFKKIASRAILIETAILTIVALIVLANKIQTLEYFVVVWIIVILLIQFYLPKKVQKNIKNNRR